MVWSQLIKRILILLGVMILMAGIMAGCSKNEEIYYDDRLIINKGEDFNSGEKKNVELNDEGEIVLTSSATEGQYISPILKTKAFKDIVVSWNADTPDDTEVEIMVQTKLDDEWSQWFSYGKWSSNGYKGSVRNQRDSVAVMDIDTLKVLSLDGAEYLRYSVKLTRKDANTPSPRLRNIFIALNLVEKVEPVLASDLNYLVELDVPERSQMVVPEIGNVICSPTSLSMVLEYYGYDLETEEVAEKVLDEDAYIYGNWSYNVAFGGTKCKYAYVERCNSINDIKEKIAQGIPVIASIKTQSEKELTGAPQAYPSGHLLVVRGFTIKDGEEYVIVNDPAAPEVETVRREYKVSEFEKAWNNKIVYILRESLE